MTATLFIGFLALTAIVVVALCARYLNGRTAAGVLAGLSVWFIYVGLMGYFGVVRNTATRPPGIAFILFPIVVFLVVVFILLFKVRSFAYALAFPLWIILCTQSFRIAVELFLHQLWMDGVVPKMLTFEGANVKEREKVFDRVLVSVGRKPNSEIPGLDKTQVKVGPKGFIQVNKQLQTDDPAICAIGDVVGEPMLAHKASHEGRTAVEAIAGHKVAFEPNAIPAVVFTDPEIAWGGLTETQAQKENREIKVARFPWAASGRATTIDRTEGMTKLIVDPQTERVLGVGIVGAGAGELIAEGVLAIEMGALAKDIALTIHPHPTLSETIMESAEVFFGTSTHVYRPKRP